MEKKLNFLCFYDSLIIFSLQFKSKFQASLKWLLTKSYGSSIPKHLNEPFFEENEVSSRVNQNNFKFKFSNDLFLHFSWANHCGVILSAS